MFVLILPNKHQSINLRTVELQAPVACTGKALTRLHTCAVSPEPSLIATLISSNFELTQIAMIA